MSRSGLVNRCLAAVRLLLVPVQLLQCNASVILTSSIEDQGRVAACPKEEVVFTCRTIEAHFLFWQSDQFPETRFRYDSELNVPMFPGEFTATLTEFVEDPNEDSSGNITSTLAVNATVGLNGTVIACTDTIMTEDQTLLIADMASPPLNPNSIIQTYHRHNFTVRVEWEDSTLGADTYTISSDTSMESTSVPGSETSVILTLSYNMVHTVNITATLCGDISEAMTANITKVSCGDPTPPSNGSIGDYESTAEGTEVNYQCDDGLIPGGEMMTTCLANGTWSPDPAELECVEPPQSECRYPVLSPNASVEGFSNTVEGLVVIYSCNPGLVPEGEFRSVCREGTDTWDPDPAILMCREPGTPVDCGYPDPLVNGSFEGDITSTVEGSEITYQCDDGLSPEGTMTAVCGKDGEWRPNPGDVECRSTTEDSSTCSESNALSSGAVISIAAVATFVVAFTLGNITGALVLYCIICTVRRKGSYSINQEPQPPAPEYEQVSLEPRKIELRENVAYGPM